MCGLENILSFEQVGLIYQAENGEVEALKDISFSVQAGELLSVVGPSGGGKTTILSLIAGLEHPTSGRVVIAGQEVSGISSKTGYMLQKDNLLDWRTIRKNVLLGLEIRGMLTAEHVDYADNLLKVYGLWEFRDGYPRQLSGGMRQRAALIRTLATKPDILLLDEAFSALDYQTRLVVADDVFNILKREKKTAVIVTHDISEGISMADRILMITKRPGRVKLDMHLTFAGADAPISPLKRRDAPEFRGYFNQVWKELDIHAP